MVCGRWKLRSGCWGSELFGMVDFFFTAEHAEGTVKLASRINFTFILISQHSMWILSKAILLGMTRSQRVHRRFISHSRYVGNQDNLVRGARGGEPGQFIWEHFYYSLVSYS
jgi:hypothetical protein